MTHQVRSAAGDTVVEVPEEAVLFDALKGDGPTTLFGPVLDGHSFLVASKRLQTMAAVARSRIAGTFGTELATLREAAETLDGIVSEMWDTGWSPKGGDINLFTRDFGSVLAAALLELPGAIPVFRSKRMLDHMSVWFPGQCLEVFPFHKTVKCLREKQGESMGQLYRFLVA
jgi:hypothetical protein